MPSEPGWGLLTGAQPCPQDGGPQCHLPAQAGQREAWCELPMHSDPAATSRPLPGTAGGSLTLVTSPASPPTPTGREPAHGGFRAAPLRATMLLLAGVRGVQTSTVSEGRSWAGSAPGGPAVQAAAFAPGALTLWLQTQQERGERGTLSSTLLPRRLLRAVPLPGNKLRTQQMIPVPATLSPVQGPTLWGRREKSQKPGTEEELCHKRDRTVALITQPVRPALRDLPPGDCGAPAGSYPAERRNRSSVHLINYFHRAGWRLRNPTCLLLLSRPLPCLRGRGRNTNVTQSHNPAEHSEHGTSLEGEGEQGDGVGRPGAL